MLSTWALSSPRARLAFPLLPLLQQRNVITNKTRKFQERPKGKLSSSPAKSLGPKEKIARVRLCPLLINCASINYHYVINNIIYFMIALEFVALLAFWKGPFLLRARPFPLDLFPFLSLFCFAVKCFHIKYYDNFYI